MKGILKSTFKKKKKFLNHHIKKMGHWHCRWDAELVAACGLPMSREPFMIINSINNIKSKSK